MKVQVGMTPNRMIILRGSATDASGRLLGEFIRQVPVGGRYAGIAYDQWVRHVDTMVDIDELKGQSDAVVDESRLVT